jgi:hypothetical protein
MEFETQSHKKSVELGSVLGAAKHDTSSTRA